MADTPIVSNGRITCQHCDFTPGTHPNTATWTAAQAHAIASGHTIDYSVGIWARRPAERNALPAGQEHLGLPEVSVSVGYAICPEDGTKLDATPGTTDFLCPDCGYEFRLAAFTLTAD